METLAEHMQSGRENRWNNHCGIETRVAMNAFPYAPSILPSAIHGFVRRFLLTFVLLPLGLSVSCAQNPALDEAQSPRLGQISLPEGFVIDVFASEVDGARSLAMSDGGTLFVGTRDEGKVYALVDTDGDYRADARHVVAEGMNSPNGVAFKDGDLYVAEIDKIWRFENVDEDLENPPEPVLVSDAYPSDGHHGWKYIAFGPDGKLYVPVGAPCNICLSEERIYATITRMDPDGSNQEIFAEGIRNTVGFDWHPETDELWFTDNGRDWMGNTTPPDELNRAPRPGLHFGYPFCHGDGLTDPEFGSMRDCEEFTMPVQALEAHTAALGMTFYTGDTFPEEYRNQIFIAEHGSWNRTPPFGYRVTLVRLDDEGKAISYEAFAEGWLREGEAWGRPVDILQLSDGSLLVSDDFGDAIYRIRYDAGAQQ